MSTTVQCSCEKSSVTAEVFAQEATELKGLSRFTIHGWRSGILTIGETPRAAMAGTASCIAASIVVVRRHFSARLICSEVLPLGCMRVLHSLSGHRYNSSWVPTIDIAMLTVHHDPVRARPGEDSRDIGAREHLPNSHRGLFTLCQDPLQAVGCLHR